MRAVTVSSAARRSELGCSGGRAAGLRAARLRRRSAARLLGRSLRARPVSSSRISGGSTGRLRRSVGAAWYTGAMLHELRIENLLLIDRAELRLAPGLNVVTGETGAGKTLLAQSLDLLLGRARRERRGARRRGRGLRRGRVLAARLSWRPRSCCPTGAEEIVLARRVWPDGRTRAYVCGRSATRGRPARARAARCCPSTASTSTAG